MLVWITILIVLHQSADTSFLYKIWFESYFFCTFRKILVLPIFQLSSPSITVLQMASQQAAAVSWRVNKDVSEESLMTFQIPPGERQNHLFLRLSTIFTVPVIFKVTQICLNETTVNIVKNNPQQGRDMTNLVGITDGRPQQHPVALHKFLKGVADWVSQIPDVDGVHHAGISQLTHTQLSVKHLEDSRVKWLWIFSLWGSE